MSNHSKYSLIEPFEFEGLNIRELTPPAPDFSSLAEIEVPPGRGHRQARSSKCAKIYICTSGVVSFNIDHSKVEMSPTDTLYIKTDQWFSYQNKGTEIAKLLLFHSPDFDLSAEEFK